MEPDASQGLPYDVLIVEDDAIIALDFEDTILNFGVKQVRTAGSVARALALIADRAPDFAVLDVALAADGPAKAMASCSGRLMLRTRTSVSRK